MKIYANSNYSMIAGLEDEIRSLIKNHITILVEDDADWLKVNTITFDEIVEQAYDDFKIVLDDFDHEFDNAVSEIDAKEILNRM